MWNLFPQIWVDGSQTFLFGGPSDTLHLILYSAATLDFFAGLQTLTAAASSHNRFLLSFNLLSH